MLITCQNGHPNNDGTNFCSVCGLAISAAVTTPLQANQGHSTHTLSPFPVAAQPAKNRTLFYILIPVGLIVLVIAGVLIQKVNSPKTTTVKVTQFVYDDSGCNFSIGYGDVPGSQVLIEADGKIVGSSKLSEYGNEVGTACSFASYVDNVPMDAEFYSITIGSRGTLTASNADMILSNWDFDASLGN